jgi:hypothetical protein
MSPHFKLSFLTGGVVAVNKPMSTHKVWQKMAVFGSYTATKRA